MPKTILPNFIGDHEHLESVVGVTSEQERFHIHARNLLKHLIRGTPLCQNDGDSYSTSPLVNEDIINTLLVKRKAALMDALRAEMQMMLLKAHSWLNDAENGDETTRNRCELFINHIITAYPFFDPEDGEAVKIPVKINQEWQLVEYSFDKIDISPTKGPLSWVLEDEDRIYAYGLKTEAEGVNNHLLLMGTTFPGGQGSTLADLYNIKPMHSVGEGHSFRQLGTWLNSQPAHHVIVSGHSKGATMSMIAAAKWPDKIKAANCFNPAGLSHDTLAFYHDSWISNDNPDKPEINVLINEGDIVPYLDAGFLPGTKITRIKSDATQLAMNFNFPSFLSFLARGYEAHIHHFAGRATTSQESVSVEEMNSAPARHVLSSIRSTVSWLLFPVAYVSLFTTIIGRKLERFYTQHKLTILALLLICGVALAVALSFSGVGPVLFSLAGSYLLALHLPISLLAVKAMATTLVALAIFLTPLILGTISPLLISLGKKVLMGVASGIALITGVTLGVVFGLGKLVFHTLSKKNTSEETSSASARVEHVSMNSSYLTFSVSLGGRVSRDEILEKEPYQNRPVERKEVDYSAQDLLPGFSNS